MFKITMLKDGGEFIGAEIAKKTTIYPNRVLLCTVHLLIHCWCTYCAEHDLIIELIVLPHGKIF